MKIHFLGTCSGTEPMQERNHTSFVLETGDKLYFFDAGENCSRSAYLSGLDIMSIKAIFVSHPHIDHIGGLANLVWLVEKLRTRTGNLPKHGGFDLVLPDMDIWEGVKKLLKYSSAASPRYRVEAQSVREGITFDDGTLRVTAYRNAHMVKYECSFSYKIECEGKKVVYSGDVKDYCEMSEAIGEYCDALICETGHHSIDSTHEYLSNKKIDKIFYNHHGREILGAVEGCRERVKLLYGGRAAIADDGMTVEV